MQTDQLSRDQLEALFNQLAPIVDYLHRLEDRMFGLAFDQDDRFYTLIRTAHRAVHEARMQAHYLACDGVGRPSKRRAERSHQPKRA